MIILFAANYFYNHYLLPWIEDKTSRPVDCEDVSFFLVIIMATAIVVPILLSVAGTVYYMLSRRYKQTNQLAKYTKDTHGGQHKERETFTKRELKRDYMENENYELNYDYKLTSDDKAYYDALSAYNTKISGRTSFAHY